MLSEAEYGVLATDELHALLGALDELGDDLDAELSGDILTIEVGGQTYVLNSHTAARQIWLAAERQAWHFDYDRALRSWVARKSGDELWGTLESLLQRKLSPSLRLSRP